MSPCGRGSLVFWLLTMLVAGASLCARDVLGRNLERSRSHSADKLGGSADWRDWLLEEDAHVRPPSSDADPGPFVRRITPKSVFVAPSFSGCSEGYRQDGMGRCVKFVKVNQAAQLDFILQKLNSKFASVNNKNKEKDDSGPFHVNIPLSFGSTRPKDQGEEDNVKGGEPTTTTDRITTTPTKIELSEGIVSVQSPLVTPVSNESEHRPKPEKRQPEGIRPFVIVVADDDHPFRSPTETTTDVYDRESITDAVPNTTTDFTTFNTVTTTDLGETDNDKGVTAAGPLGVEEATESVTPFYDTSYVTSSSDPVTESFDTPTKMDFEPLRTNDDDVLKIDGPTTVASTPNTFFEDKSESVTSFQEEDSTGFVPFDYKRVPMKQEESSQRPSTDCRNTRLGFGRIVNAADDDDGCPPVATTPAYPVLTTAPPGRPHRIRFPTDDIFSRPPPFPYTYSDVSSQDGYKTTGFVRFPERLSISASHRPVPHGDVLASSSTSSDPWRSPPSSSWFSFLQSHKHWMPEYMPVSTVYRKQYHPTSSWPRSQ